MGSVPRVALVGSLILVVLFGVAATQYVFPYQPNYVLVPNEQAYDGWTDWSACLPSLKCQAIRSRKCRPGCSCVQSTEQRACNGDELDQCTRERTQMINEFGKNCSQGPQQVYSLATHACTVTFVSAYHALTSLECFQASFASLTNSSLFNQQKKQNAWIPLQDRITAYPSQTTVQMTHLQIHQTDDMHDVALIKTSDPVPYYECLPEAYHNYEYRCWTHSVSTGSLTTTAQSAAKGLNLVSPSYKGFQLVKGPHANGECQLPKPESRLVHFWNGLFFEARMLVTNSQCKNNSITMMPTDNCNEYFGYASNTFAYICAGNNPREYQSSEALACLPDKGAPVICQPDDGKSAIYGQSIKSTNCFADKTRFVSVISIKEWLEDKIKSDLLAKYS